MANPSKLKQFIGSLIFAILIATIFFYKIQEKLTPSTPPKIDSSAIQKTDEKKSENDPKKDHNKTKEPDKTKPTLTWEKFSEKLQHFENKRQEVLTQLGQKLPNYSPDKTVSSLQTHALQMSVTKITNEINNEEEKASWGKVIQHWQQLNDQQQRLSKSNKTEDSSLRKSAEEN
jgi:hypothetical protein